MAYLLKLSSAQSKKGLAAFRLAHHKIIYHTGHQLSMPFTRPKAAVFCRFIASSLKY
jgi:hypothetical protein